MICPFIYISNIIHISTQKKYIVLEVYIWLCFHKLTSKVIEKLRLIHLTKLDYNCNYHDVFLFYIFYVSDNVISHKMYEFVVPALKRAHAVWLKQQRYYFSFVVRKNHAGPWRFKWYNVTLIGHLFPYFLYVNIVFQWIDQQISFYRSSR